MKKIRTLFSRDERDRKLVTREFAPETAWFRAGEGIATIKYDGTSCLVKGGRIYKRYTVKKGKTIPAGFEPAQANPDLVTGDFPGWILVGDNPEDRWHREAFAFCNPPVIARTYELIGPKIQGNPYDLDHHILVPHTIPCAIQPPRDYDGIHIYLIHCAIEGVVWHHTDGIHSVKIKRRDFGLPWPTPVGEFFPVRD